MLRKILILTILGLVAVGGYYSYKILKYNKEEVPVAVDIATVESQAQGANSQESGQQTQQLQNLRLPDSLNLKMVFYSQAPFSDWGMPWQEACEEASVLLVANTYLHKNWTREQFRDEILKLVDWEKQHFGDYKHTTVAQTAQILNEYLGLKTVIHEAPSYADIKQILNRGHLIVMTFAGKRLGNPNYRNGGPNYHAMVIKGYKEGEKVITEDVGTKNGENYVFSWGVIQNALHDYAEPIENGPKRMIEVLPLT